MDPRLVSFFFFASNVFMKAWTTARPPGAGIGVAIRFSPGGTRVFSFSGLREGNPRRILMLSSSAATRRCLHCRDVAMGKAPATS